MISTSEKLAAWAKRGQKAYDDVTDSSINDISVKYVTSNLKFGYRVEEVERNLQIEVYNP